MKRTTICGIVLGVALSLLPKIVSAENLHSKVMRYVNLGNGKIFDEYRIGILYIYSKGVTQYREFYYLSNGIFVDGIHAAKITDEGGTKKAQYPYLYRLRDDNIIEVWLDENQNGLNNDEKLVYIEVEKKRKEKKEEKREGLTEL